MAAITFGAGINAGTGAITTNAATYTTPSFTPAANDLLVAVCGVTDQTATNWAVSGSAGGTWTKVRRQVKDTSTDILEIWIRNSLSAASSQTVTFSHATGNATGGMLIVLRVSGMTKTGNSGAALTQGGQDNQAASGTPTPVLSATPSSSNPIITAVSNATNPCGVTPRTGYTSHNNNGYGTPSTGFRLISLDSGETTATLAWGGTSATAFCSIAVELDSSGSTPTSFVWQPAQPTMYVQGVY